ncbi:hypothetical protein ACXX9E_29615 [Pseudomonas sp. GNP014]
MTVDGKNLRSERLQKLVMAPTAKVGEVRGRARIQDGNKDHRDGYGSAT